MKHLNDKNHAGQFTEETNEFNVNNLNTEKSIIKDNVLKVNISI